MPTFNLRLWGQKLSGAYQYLLADNNDIKGLHVFLRPPVMVDNGPWAITESWAEVASLDDRFVLTELQILNPSGGAITFSLAFVELGEDYASGDEILATDVELAGGSVWEWQGRKSKIGNPLYAIADDTGLVLRAVAEEVPV